MKSLNLFFAMIVTCLISIGAFAHQYEEQDEADAQQDVKKELRMLRKDIRRLESIIMDLVETIEDGNGSNRSDSDKWGCYLDDLTAGGLYATGRTQAEAKGKVLQHCSDKKGSCWESKVKCNQAE